MKKSASALALLSWVLMLVSLWLPAESLAGQVFFGFRLSGNYVILGWQAAWLSVASVQDMLHDRDALIMFTHGVTNVLVLVGPLMVLLGRATRWRWLAHLTVAAALYNLRVGQQLDA